MEYFILQEGDRTAFDELEQSYGTRKPERDLGRFMYLTDYDPKIEKLKGRAARMAPWWNIDEAGRCTFVQVGTNIQGTTWSMNLFAFRRGSNAVLYTHIIEDVE